MQDRALAAPACPIALILNAGAAFSDGLTFTLYDLS
jgi:hypothetical protein